MDKVQIIENGVDIPALNKPVDAVNAKQKLGLSADTVLILSVGRLVSRKHVELLLKAERLLKKETLAKHKIVIIGEGPERTKLSKLVKEYDLAGIVDLPGRISDEQRDIYYRAADIYVLTSSYEGFPITMLEAMACGTAVINSRILSVSNLREGLDSLSFTPGDAHALSACIKTLLIDQSLRNRLSTSARILAEQHSWRRIAEETRKVYFSLV